MSPLCVEIRMPNKNSYAESALNSFGSGKDKILFVHVTQ